MESSEAQVETASLLARQPSGIRALPSHDDDDDNDGGSSTTSDIDPLFETNNSPLKSAEKNVSNSTTTSSNGSNSSSNSDFTTSSNGTNGSFVSGEQEYENPDDGVPKKTVFLEGQDDGPASGPLLGLKAPKAGVPIAKVSNDEEEEEEDGDGYEEEEVVGGGVYGAKSGAPKVRVLGQEDDGAGEENGDEGSIEESKVGKGVEFTDEGDAVVDSINVDVVEAVRSGAAVVRVDDDEGEGEGPKTVVEGDEVKSSNVEDSTNVDDVVGSGAAVAEEMEKGKEEGTAVAQEPASSDGVKLTEEGDSVVDSIRVDASEAVRSGTAVVGEVEDKKVSGEGEGGVAEKPAPVVEDSVAEESAPVGVEDSAVEESAPVVEDSVVEKSAPVVEDSVVEKPAPAVEDSAPVVEDSVVEEPAPVVEDSVVEKPAPAVEDSAPAVEDSVVEEPAPVVENSVVEESTPVDVKATETDVNVAGEDDSVVDKINVDAVEAVRSGVAVVGDSGVEETGTEVQDVGAPVGENVKLGNEFEPLVDSKPETESNNDVESAEIEQLKEGEVDETEKPRSVEILEPLSKEDVKPETDTESKRHELADEPQAVTAGDEEKVQPHEVDDKPDDTASDTIQKSREVEKTEEDDNQVEQGKVNDGDSETDGESDPVLSGVAADSSQPVEELERASDPLSRSGGYIVTDSEEEADSDEEGEEKELFDSAALAALLKAATSAGSDSGPITITSQDGSRLFSVERPAGLGPSLRPVRPASRPSNSSPLIPPGLGAPSEENLSDEEKKNLQHIQQLKVKFLRLVYRLGFTADDSIAAQVLYKMALLAGRPTSPAFSLENAKQTAVQLEAEGKNDLDFSLNILVLGKTGVGKSATINSIFGEEKVKINAFEPETTSVQVVSGIVDGVKIRVIDAPGLRSSAMEQGFNRKVLASVKRFTKKYPPDIMLYVDRLDSQTRDLNDIPMLRTITSSLGTSIWRSAIVTLTHASSAPPDGPSGSPLSYEVFVAQRSHIVQQSIGQAVGDLRLMNPSLMNPVSFVENHPACRKNREGQRVLPNGQAWRPQLLLLCYSLKFLSEASSTLKPQDPFDHRKLFGFRVRSTPLPYLISSMLQSRPHPKLAADQGGDSVDSDIDLDDLSDSDQEEEEDEYDQLPPFKPLRKSQIAKLDGYQRKAYFEEYDYRVKLLQKKQWREELKRMREMKKKGKSDVDEFSETPEDVDGENGGPAAVPVPLPDMALPPSFDSDNPAYRYRFLEPTSQFLARPVLDTHGWDHDCGYDGVNVEQNLGIAGRFPAAVVVQVTKDKKEFNVHLDSGISAKHGDTGSSLVGFDVQTLGKRYAYTVRGESKFKTLKKNKTGAGVSVTFLGEDVATGVKAEDQLTLGKRLVLVGSAGTVRVKQDAAYGANFEVRLREADYPIGQDQSSFALSLMKWRGDLAVGGNLLSQFSVGRSSKMAVRVSLNNKLSGQISVRTSSSDHMQLALAGLLPIALSIYRHFKPGVSENYSIY